MVAARAEVARLQRRLWERQRALIARSVTGGTQAFRRYEDRVLARTSGFERVARYSELLHEVAAADLVYVGDYHTHRQSQRSFLKLLEHRWPLRPAVLALEFVQGRHQRALDAFLAGRTTEARFLEQIEYRRHAIFDTWPHFRPLFEHARKARLRVVGIDLLGDARTTLAARDRYAARRIAEVVQACGDAQVFTLAGQLHVAPPHLPRQVAGELSARGLGARRALVVYQNAERIWWQLQRSGRELDTEVVRIADGEYCLINTPPVIVQQTYLDWIEGGSEPLESTRLARRFRMLARTVARFLRLDTPALRAALSEVEVYTAGDLGFAGRLREHGFTAREAKAVERRLLSRESCYIPRARAAVLANLSVNHAAEEATHFLRHVVSGADDAPRPLVDAFYARVLEEAYAFCGSKIVNPRRKCPHEAEFERLAAGGDAFTRKVARLVLAHLRVERTGRAGRSSGAGSGELFDAVTHSLGYMLGDKLHHALMQGAITRREVRALFVDALGEAHAPIARYLELAARLREVVVPKRV